MLERTGRQKHLLCRLLTIMLLAGGVLLPKPVFAASDVIPELTSTRIEANSAKTRFSANLNIAVGYNVYVLPDPYRVIIDIPDAIFNLPRDAGIEGKGLISGFRFGQLDDNRSRIVIDVTGPVLIQNSYAVRAKKDRPARLIVDLIPTDGATFAKIHQGDQVANLVAREQAKSSSDKGDGIIPEESPAVSDGVMSGDPIAELLKGKKPLTKKKSVKSIRKPVKKKNKLVIVIDPGHGGIDSGTRSKRGLLEKKVVLAFSRKLKARLKSLGRYKVIMTRNNDTFIQLRDRIKIAHKNRADLFIAIHADAIKYSSVRGTTLYTLSDTASDEEAAELAAKENRSDIIGGVKLAGENKAITNILIDLAQRDTKNHSVYFAKKAVSHLKRVTKMAKRPLRAAGFVVLKAPDVPSVLLELGYLSNRKDAKLLASVAWQKKVAKSLAQSIDNYFRARVALQ